MSFDELRLLEVFCVSFVVNDEVKVERARGWTPLNSRLKDVAINVREICVFQEWRARSNIAKI